MRALVLLFVLAVLLSACRGHSNAPPSQSPTVAPNASTTPLSGAVYLYRLDTFEKVYEAFVTGRIPAGLANETKITVADARIDGFYVSDTLPQNRQLHLSIVGAPRADFSGPDGPDYEWWFVVTDETDSQRPVQINADAPELRIGLRNVQDTWGLYVDTGAGWQPISGTFAFGELEVSATVRIDEGWPLVHARLAYMRAVVRHRPATPEGYDVGDVYPEDLLWNIVTE
jgi:hypothetical protein